MTQAADSFGKAVARAIETLQAQGFGVLASTDLEKKMKKMLDVEGRSYRILGASAAPPADRKPTADPSIVVLLPNNVFVREEEDGHITVGVMNPIAVLQLAGDHANDEIVQAVRGRLEEAHDKLAAA